MQRALEDIMGDLCLARTLPDDPAAIRAWLERHEVAPDDVEFLLDSGFERLLVYRRLVRDNLYAALEVSIPRTMARMEDTFDTCFARFLAERGPQTHYLRDVVDEFLAFVEPTWKSSEEIPSYLFDLARHEALRIQIGAMQARDADDVAPELDLDRAVRFIEAARVVRYDHPVHELIDDEHDRTVPEPRPVALLVYRSPRHEVRFLELTPMAGDLLDGLLDRKLTLRNAMLNATERNGYPVNEAVIGGAARLLADLAERGALLGTG